MSAPQLGPSPAQITMMGHNISARIVAAKWRRRRRVRLTIAAAGLAAGVAVTAAGIGVAAAPPDVQARGFTCYTVDDLSGVFHVVPYPQDLPAPSPSERVAAALEMCDLGYGMNGVQAPHPTACVLPDLRIGVFPNLRGLEAGEFCESLGLGLAV
jgi:hypothetical protein